jgi:hypothetical protein
MSSQSGQSVGKREYFLQLLNVFPHGFFVHYWLVYATNVQFEFYVHVLFTLHKNCTVYRMFCTCKH